MDQNTRNTLRNVVTQCRRLLEDSVAQVLQGQFGIFAVGKKDEVQIEPEARMSHLSEEDRAYRQDLLDHFEHIKALGYKAKDALAQLIREVAFTHLNRFCAYRMMESRSLIRESVSKGLKSQGFLFYLADHEEDERRYNTGQQDLAYRHFLNWLGGTLSEEIGVLFAPTDPANRLYPPQRVIDEVLGLLNDPELAGIWSEDEAIGWVYQYFTPKELRDQARKESQAPRNSYELAFRNQFFTPRYVVEFLTDNTLGRIWYEMRRGDTRLKDQCRYMVRRPTEVFLKEGENEPDGVATATEDLSQEELLKLPVYVPFRAKKDPRELRILDPACGSGHFLLYCFDLLLTIYEEAYSDPDLSPALKEDYPRLDDLHRDVPRLILAHNLHGIDIDLRASQIAALALWLRCQRAYQEMGIKQDRPKITRSNVVCAEPMPGEEQMLKEFIEQLQPRILGHIVEAVFDKMQLAGEAGSLLAIDEEIRATVAAAKKQYVKETTAATDRKGHALLFTEAEMGRLTTGLKQESLFDVSDITDSAFFEQAERKAITALQSYAEQANAGQRLSRSLFSEDCVRGFAFVDVCQKRYDAVLMNPPFGLASKMAKKYIDSSYPVSKRDLYSAFVERALRLSTKEGRVALISSRTGFFLNSFTEWREQLLLKQCSLEQFVDLGNDVLDTALVETAAYVLRNSPPADHTRGVFLRLGDLPESEKQASLRATLCEKEETTRVFTALLSSFRDIPGSPLAYWITPNFLRLFKAMRPVEADGREARVGVQTSDDFRFARLWSEIPPAQMLGAETIGTCATKDIQQTCIAATGNGIRWVPFAKGGGFHQYSSNHHLFLDWEQNGEALKQFNAAMYGSVSRNVRSESCYFRPGITWSYLPHLRGSFRLMPSGSIFSVGGPGLFADADKLLSVLGVLNSDVFFALISLFMPRGSGGSQTLKFEVGYVQKVPYPYLDDTVTSELTELATRLYRLWAGTKSTDETSLTFEMPSLAAAPRASTLATGLREWQERVANAQATIAGTQTQVNDLVLKAYGLERVDQEWIEAELNRRLVRTDDPEEESRETAPDELDDEANDISPWRLSSEVVSWALGTVFGRWDVRLAVRGGLSAPPPSPLSLFSICAPAMLVGENGLPISCPPNEYPIAICSEGITPDDSARPDDVVLRVRDVLTLIWADRGEAIEKEISQALAVKELRDYFRKPGKGGFWDDHVSRYSKSRRKAPIYWLLQSSKKNYAIWIYYHRLDKDILFKALVNYVEPKIRLENDRLESLRSEKASGGSGKGAKKLDKEIEKQEEFLSELGDFEEKLRRAADLHLVPDLNDGVVLNIAPLHELVPWNEAEKYWEELLEGKYEWSSIGKQLREKGLVK